MDLPSSSRPRAGTRAGIESSGRSAQSGVTTSSFWSRGRRWFIPSMEIDAHHSIVVGGARYGEFEIGADGRWATPSRIEGHPGERRSWRAERDCKSRALVAEWVRIPPPPFTRSNGPPTNLATAKTRLSANHQLTIPLQPFAAAELEVGDELKVEARGPGEISLTRMREVAQQYASTLFGDAGSG